MFFEASFLSERVQYLSFERIKLQSLFTLFFSCLNPRINCNLDLIVPGIKLLKSLGQKPGQHLDSVSLESLEDLTNTFTHYFVKGAAAERTFLSKEIYQMVIDKAAKLEGTEVRILFKVNSTKR